MGADDKLTLVVDGETLEAFLPLGIVSLYDQVVVPDEITGVDPKYFFALIKLRGLSDIKAPVYSVDWDLFILKQALFDNIRESGSCGLHYECTCGGAYKSPERYSCYLPMRSFEKSPINCGVIGFASESDKRQYCDFVFEFMRRYSASPLSEQAAVFVMMFAEQQLLGFLSRTLGIKVLLGSGGFDDGSCLHLWGMKTGLDTDKGQSDRHRNWCRNTMSQHGIKIPKFLDSPGARALP